jgi:hypothetical protein
MTWSVVQTFKALAFICSHLEFLQARIREVGLVAAKVRSDAIAPGDLFE